MDELIDCRPGGAPLDMPALLAQVAALRQRGRPVRLGGALEPPDLPRLRLLDPDEIVVRGQQMPPAGKPRPARPIADTVFVRGFVLPVPIGAYLSEEAAPQRVRFDVWVDLAPPSREPRAMADVFSYDVITDGIRLLAAAGHVRLIETLAERVAALLLGQPRVLRVRVRAQKLDLPGRRAGVDILRGVAEA